MRKWKFYCEECFSANYGGQTSWASGSLLFAKTHMGKLHIPLLWYTYKTRNYHVVYFVILTSLVVYFMRDLGGSNNHIQFLNNISPIFTHFFTHTYFHKCFQTTIFSFGIITVNPPEVWPVCTLPIRGIKLITLPPLYFNPLPPHCPPDPQTLV